MSVAPGRDAVLRPAVRYAMDGTAAPVKRPWQASELAIVIAVAAVQMPAYDRHRDGPGPRDFNAAAALCALAPVVHVSSISSTD